MLFKKTGFPSHDKTELKGVSFFKRHPLILNRSLLSTFYMVNKRSLGKVAIERDGKAWTKNQLYNDSVMYAKALAALELRAGDTLAIITQNIYEAIVFTFAANVLAIKVVYLNPDPSAKEEVEAKIRAHHVRAALVERNGNLVLAMTLVSYLLPMLKELSKSVSDKEIKRLFARNAHNRESLIYIQTSGSTSGIPKTPMFTNQAVFASLMYAKNSTGTKTHDASVSKVLCIIPLRIPYGWMTAFVNILGGNRVEFATSATPEAIGEWYKLKPSYIYGTPQFLTDFIANTPPGADLSFLKAFFCAGFATKEELFEEGYEFLHKHNCWGEIRNNYGIGEALCIGTASDGVVHKPGTSGKFYVGIKRVLVDDGLQEVKYGEVGELLIWSKSLMEGYFGDKKATEAAFVNFRGKRYFRTGDLLCLDEDGYVTFIDRKKRFYQPRGATDKVNCETIEKAFMKATNVVKSVSVEIYSLPDKSETSAAFVVLENGIIPSAETRLELMKFLTEKAGLHEFQLPTKILFLEELPLMSSGKIDHIALKKLLS